MRLTTHEPHIIYLSNNTMVSHKRNSHDDPLKNLDKKQPKFLGQLVNPSKITSYLGFKAGPAVSIP